MVQLSRKKLFFTISLILTVCLALATVLTEVFVFQNLDHACSGEDCPFCLQIKTVQDMQKAFIFAAFFAGLSAYREASTKTAPFSAGRSRTLVLLKVQSNP